MRYQQVCVESLAYSLPSEVVSSDEIERRLKPLYQRLRLPEGRLELITGIRERRVWPAEMLPSEASVLSAEKAIGASGVERGKIGALIHASVCRDYLEPATACAVHRQLGLSPACTIYDVSNACLGIMNGMLQIANMIELGQIEAGLVVGTESSRSLLETTIASLNADESLTRKSVKSAVASLTIGSGSAAVLLTHRSLSRTNNRLTAGVARANTEHHDLCQSPRDDAVGQGMQPLMETDSEQLMREGIRTGQETFRDLLREGSWEVDDLQRTFCHQVGETHRRQMLESLGIPVERDYATLSWLGNTGSVALPMTMALGVEEEFAGPGERLALLGIGSGINCVMLAVEWNKTLAERKSDIPSPHWQAKPVHETS